MATLSVPGGHGATSAAFSPDGKTLAVVGAANGDTCLWNVATRQLTATLDDTNDMVGHLGGYSDQGGVESLAFLADGTLAAPTSGS